MQNITNPDILTFEEIQERKSKVFNQEEWNDFDKWMDDIVASAKSFRERNPV